MARILHLVIGAPGVGKSTTVEAFLHLNSRFLAFDMDWCLDAASTLASQDIRVEPTTWPAFHALWLAILTAIDRNHQSSVFFAPVPPQDVVRYGHPSWCSRIEWLLLDCEDEVLRHRLMQREGWNESIIAEVLAHAQELRKVVARRIDTGSQSPDQVAQQLHHFLQHSTA